MDREGIPITDRTSGTKKCYLGRPTFVVSCEESSNPLGLVSEIAPEATQRRSWLAGKYDCHET